LRPFTLLEWCAFFNGRLHCSRILV
jgi:hypothetical protein